MSTTAVEVDLVSERKIVLAPFLERLVELGELGGDDPTQARALGFPPGFSLEPWERTSLKKALAGGGDADDRWPRLLTEGLAFQALCSAQQEQHAGGRAAPADDPGEQRDRQTRTAAIGLALLEEIQCVIDEKILAGRMGEVKRLTGFRNRVARFVGQIKTGIGAEGIREAEQLAREMNASAESQAEEDQTHRPQMIKLDRRRRRGKTPTIVRMRRKKKRSRVGPLLLVLVASITAWVVLILPRSFHEELPVLTAEELAFSPVITDVQARPPSLFIDVDGAGWEQMPAAQRDELVRQVASSAEAAGYIGAEFRVVGGRSVARWSQKRGVSMVDPVDEKS